MRTDNGTGIPATSAPSSADAQPTLYGDMKPPPITTATFRGKKRPLLVPAYSLGRDSTAALIKLRRLGIIPDLILFADTGVEKQSTYDYLPVINDWLRWAKFPEVTVVRKRSPHTCDVTLEDEALRLGVLPSISYGRHSCSLKHKKAPQDFYLNHWEPALRAWKRGERVVRLIGYEADECKRIDKAKTYRETHPCSKFSYWELLVEYNMRLEECIELIEDEGLPVPEKSACFFCGAAKKWEIEQLARVDPARFLRALLIERVAEPKNLTVKGLGRNFAWSSLPCAAPFLEELDWIMEERERTRRAGFIPLTRGARILHGVTPPAATSEWPIAA